MSKLTHKLFHLTIAPAIFLFAGAAFNIRAQESPPKTGRAPRPTTTPAPLPPLRNTRAKIRQGGKNQFAPGIFGRISWKKEYGLPSIDGGRTPDKATNCTAIRVQTTVQEGVSGTFGKAVNVGYIALQNEPTEENGYYICSYSITDQNNDLQRNRVIAISAILGPYASQELNRALSEGRWFGPGQPQPPPGYQRVPIGGRGITLTDAEPRATVDFEMVYRPLPAAPR